MAGDRTTAAYADALFTVARAEGNPTRVEDELFRVARALEDSDELQRALADPQVPAARRQQVVEDLLGTAADTTTVAIVSLLVGVGRSHEIPAIIDALVARAARESGREVAMVRSAVALSDDQQERLAAALSSSLGREVTVRVIVDPSVLGGIVTQIGDTVIDGSVRHRLNQLREAF
ncbi:MAG: ATP synthase F1 subunit delta [Acidimicrobiales bacterium]